MFNKNEKVYYQPEYQSKGLDISPIEARFVKVKDNDNRKAVILVKNGTEFNKYRQVNLTTLSKL